MALRNQPYIPLYVQDFMTDEKLMECSASATGVYVRIMCVMHKSKEYGTVLLKQNDKQTENIANNFAFKLAKFLPYSIDVILSGLEELLSEEVLCIDGDILYQKRMMKDGALSDKRSLAGSKGGQKTTSKKQFFAKAKVEATSENENEFENEDVINNEFFNDSIEENLIQNNFDYKSSLSGLVSNKTLVNDYVSMRQTKNASLTETAFNLLIKECEDNEFPIEKALTIAIERNWTGFKVQWVDNITKTTANGKQATTTRNRNRP